MNWFEVEFWDKGSIPFGLDQSGSAKDVSEVPRGLACACTCPECRRPLVAKKGEIKVHHFAHHDRRECRHAFEASLFQMAIDLLSQSGAQLMLPSWGDRHDWVRHARLDHDDPQVRKFLQEPAVISAQAVRFGPDVRVNTKRVSDSAWPVPEIELPAQNLSVHLLTHRKPYRQCPSRVALGDRTQIAINLSHYARLWWGQVCDHDRAERIAEAGSARATMAAWLAEETSGRGLLHHPDCEERKRQFDSWALERVERQRQKQAEAREVQRAQLKAEEKRWKVPPLPPDSSRDDCWFKPASSEKVARLPHGLPLELGLQKDTRSERWGWFGKPGQIVPSLLRTLLASSLPWEPRKSHPSCEKAKPPASSTIAAPATELPVKSLEPELLQESVGTCQRCSQPTNLLRNRVGMFAGRLVISCSRDPRHPTVYPADSDWPEFS